MSSFAESAPELTRRLRDVELNETSMEERELVSSLVTDHAARLAQRLIAESGDASRSIAAIGVLGCESWRVHAESRFFESFLRADELAEMTGLTVLDNFPSRDLAQGGLGGPVEGHGLWLLMADRLRIPGRRWRALVQLEDTFHVTVIPPLDDLARREVTISCDICSGTRLFDELFRRAKFEPLDCIATAKQAVQGKLIPEIAACWRHATGPNRLGWQPNGVSALPLTTALDTDPALQDASLPDLLKTATHFLAERVGTFMNHALPASQPVGEVILTGQGMRNGLLLQELNRQLPVVQIRRLDEIGFPEHVLAASVAALTLLHVWQIPLASSVANDVPRILGRITPGNPSNWQQVLRLMNSHARWLLPLREAV